MGTMSVKVSRETLVRMLQEKRAEVAARHEEQQKKRQAELVETRKALKEALKGNIDDLDALNEIGRAASSHLHQLRYAEMGKSRDMERYDRAITLVEMSAEDTLRVSAHSDIGALLDL